MKAIIPVAGTGHRLKPQTYTLPKALLNVAGKPILGHILDELISVGVDHVILVVGHMGDPIRAWMEKNCGIETEFVEQREARGIGHAIHLTRDLVDPDEPILIVLGDTIFKADFESVIGGPTSAIGVRAVEDPSRFGVVQVRNQNVARLVEKPDTPVSNLAIVGIYYFIRAGSLFAALAEIIDEGITTKGEVQLTDALEKMIKKGEPVRAVTVNGWFDCGEPESLLRTNRFLLEEEGSRVEIDGSIIIPPVAISPSSHVTRSVIGPYVTVGDNAVITDSIVRDSIVNDDALVENCLLDRSLVGESAVVRGNFQRLNVGDSSEVDFH
ncbi:MAG: sugar phosphate nucleotidyltransferase [Candidatus Eisenbacteria bacterium]